MLYLYGLPESILQIKEVHKYYANTPGVCDLVHKCLQVCAVELHMFLAKYQILH